MKTYRPTSPGMRFRTGVSFAEITKSTPHKPLMEPVRKTGGRNNNGRITSRYRGGGNKNRYRVIDFRRDKLDVIGRIEGVEYDPNRSAFIALIAYADGEKRYILAPEGITNGSQVISSEKEADIQPGNALPLRLIPVGTEIHNVETRLGRGGQMVRSAGSSAQIVAKEGHNVQLRLPSGEIRRVLAQCRATIGRLSNAERENVSYGKAGRKRWLGISPHVRGLAMNPVDHPHGGGEGRGKGGNHPSSPWGQLAKGYKTRHNKRTQRFIIRDRRSKSATS